LWRGGFASLGQVSNTVLMQRPRAAVFDVATTARHWPEWHPATRAVRGAIDHPVQLGEQITEDIVIAGMPGTATWTCIEYDRPNRLGLHGSGGGGTKAGIVYPFTDVEGGVEFPRALTYEVPAVAFLLKGRIDHAMQEQSAEAIENLRALLEREI